MSKSRDVGSSVENNIENVGPIVAEDRFQNSSTTFLAKQDNTSSPLLREATSPGTGFDIQTDLSFGERSGLRPNPVNPRERRLQADSEVNMLGQELEIGFRTRVKDFLDYSPFSTASSTNISWKASENEIEEELDKFKNEVEKELVNDEKERYKTTSSALEQLTETEEDVNIEDLATRAGDEISSDRLETVLEAAGDYDPSETFEEIYEVDSRDELEPENELVSNIVELEHLRDNPEKVLAEDLSEDGFSNRSEMVLKELDPEEANSIVEEAIESTQEIKSVYTDCWGNTMAVYQDNSRAKILDSEVREGSSEDGHSLSDMIDGAKEEFGEEEYLENAIDEVVAGDYDEELETWFVTEYLSDNIGSIHDIQTMEKANAILFDSLHRELEDEEEDYQDDSEATGNVEEFPNEPIYWHSHGSKEFDYGKLEDQEPSGEGTLRDSVRSIATSYLKS